jgi:hypothetical protein
MRLIVGATIVSIALPVTHALAQDRDSEERPITLVGCVMRESQFRDMYGPGISGPRGAGLGGRNEYMLVDAHEVTAAAGSTNPGVTQVGTAATCPPAPGSFPNAYELTGSREDEVGQFLGRRVELTGIQKEANARPVGTSGVLQPTGGFDPLGHELHLFEVEVESFREPVALAAAPPAAETPAAAPAPVEQPPVAAAAPPASEVSAPAPAPEPEPAPQAAAPPAPQPESPAPQPESTVAAAPVQELPRTSSPLPLAGLSGLLSVAAAAGLRSLRRRR